MSAASIGTLDVPPELSSVAVLGIRAGVNGGSGRMLAEHPTAALIAMTIRTNVRLRIPSDEIPITFRPPFRHR
jgi:hypothetical protein